MVPDFIIHIRPIQETEEAESADDQNHHQMILKTKLNLNHQEISN